MQFAEFPLRHTWVSQEMGGKTSHLDTLAVDFGVLSSDRDYDLYAPFDGHVVFRDAQSKGGAIAFQSDRKVRYADGREDYLTLITAHDNTPPEVGQAFKQGQKYSKMGTAGNVGRHCHLEAQVGMFKKYTSYTSQGYYKWPNTIEPYRALWLVKGTQIDETASVAIYPWVYLPEATRPVKRDADANQVKILVDSLRVRTDPSVNGTILGEANTGEIYNVHEQTGDDTYKWYRIDREQWIADKKGQWCEFMESELEERIRELEKENAQLRKLYDDLLEKYDKMTAAMSLNREKKNAYKAAIKKAKKYADKTVAILEAEL